MARDPRTTTLDRPSRTSRARRAVLVALALATTGVVITPSCGGQFDPPSLVNTVRVITVEADLPYGQPGETITLKMRYDDGRPDIDDPEPLQITWLGGCFNPPGDQYYGCYEPLGELVARVQAGDVSPTEFLLQGPNFDTFQVTMPDDILESRAAPAFGPKVGTAFVFFAVCAGELRPVEDAGDTDAQAFPFGCFDATGKRLGADEFVPGYTVVYAYEDGRTNANPTVNGFVFDGEPIDELTTPSVEACSVTEEDRDKTDCNAVDEFEECTTYEIDVDVPRNVAESDPDSTGVDGELLDEVVWVNYYAEAGDFDGAIKLINDADQGYQGDHGTVWVPPPEKGRYALWAVVHDSRGGTTTHQRFVDVE
jgi:hypothetical protein